MGLFFILIIDPMGALGIKVLTVLFLLLFLFFFNFQNYYSNIRLIFTSLTLAFGLMFIFKQEVLFVYEEYMSVIASTIFFAGLFSLNKSRIALGGFILCCKLVLLLNLAFIVIGIFFIDIALGLNILLKD